MPSNQTKINEQQLLYLAEKAKNNGAKSGNLLVKLSDGSTTKWNLRYFVLHLNFLFEFQNQESSKPSNVFLLEQCDFERTAMKNIHDYEHQVRASLYSTIAGYIMQVANLRKIRLIMPTFLSHNCKFGTFCSKNLLLTSFKQNGYLLFANCLKIL